MEHEENAPQEPVLSAFERLRRRLRRMAGTLTGDADAADDVLQDAFCRIWTRRRQIASEAEAAALLTVVVRRLGLDALRRRRRFPTESLDAGGPAAESLGQSLAHAAHEAEDEREALFRRIAALIDERLSPTAAEVLRSHDFRGEPYAEIAARLGLAETAVRMHLSRARRTIRDLYRKEQDLL